MTKRVLVVGGGAIGQAVWQGLHAELDFDVKILDANPDHHWKDCNWFIHEPDFFEGQTPYKYLGEADYLVMAAPIYDPQAVLPIVHDCLQTNTHYIDFSEDVVVRAEMHQQFGDTNLNAIIPGCGLAPGMVQVLAERLTAPFDEVLDIEMAVGSLPVFVSNDLGYHPMWSVDGVVNEYTNPVHGIWDGHRTVWNPLDWESYDYLSVAGVEHEMFLTSGGLGTMVDTWDGRARTVRYRTIRYPGHLSVVRDLLSIPDDTLYLREKKHYNLVGLRNALERRMTVVPVEDRVVIHIVVRGLINDMVRENVYSKDIRGMRDIGRITAIQRTTAAGAVAAIKAQAQYGFTGLTRQEDISDKILEQTGAMVWGGYFDGR